MTDSPGTSAARAPVLAADDARIAVADVVAIDRLTCTSQGDRVLCVGDVDALVAALSGVALRRQASQGDDDGSHALVVGGKL